MRLSQSTRRLVGFTLVELLVVIGIIALLISILLPSLNSARKSALKIKCQANLHNIGNALMVYASSNRGKLPATTLKPGNFSDVNWLWDIPIPVRDMLVKAGASRPTLYCPSAPESLKDVDYVWTFPKAAPNGTWSNASMDAWLRAKTEPDRVNGSGIIGYVYMIFRPDGPGMPTNTFPGITYGGTSAGFLQNSGDNRWTAAARTWKYQKSIVPDNKGCFVKKNATEFLYQKGNSSSETEIFADVVGASAENPTDFSILPGGLPNNLYQGSSHLGRNKLPIGANVLFLDGHVSWRAFNAGSKYNVLVPGGMSRPDDFFAEDVVHWRANGTKSDEPTKGIHWYW